MDRLKKPKDFLKKLRLTDSDYQDSGMINHIADLLERYNAEQLILHGVSFELPNDDIFDKPEVNLQNPLEEFYYYERPVYLEDDQKQFRERLQKALNYLRGN